MNIRPDFEQATRQATAFGLATLLTLSIFGSLDRLATPVAPDAYLSQQSAPTQVDGTMAKRLQS